MKKVVLTKISGLFLLGVLCFSCSSEESALAVSSTQTSENIQAFKSAFTEYGKTRRGEFVKKGSDSANAAMAKESVNFLKSIGAAQASIEEKARLGDEAVISYAFLEFAKLTKQNKS